ncbi:MAG: hypothetical protein N2561_04785 [Bacteroidetes bacterium]|nr:hypothetical protein [Bacteroidota bacterium]MCX7906835.1 hypothetical protein [Bacteroidota bacterium]
MFVLAGIGAAQAQNPLSPRGVVEAFLEATGGSAWEQITSLRQEVELQMMTQGMPISGKMTMVLLYPGYMRNDLVLGTPMGPMELSQVVTPEKAWMQTPHGRQEMPVINFAHQVRGPRPELWMLRDTSYRFVKLERGELNGTPVHIVHVEHEGSTSKLYFEVHSKLLVASESTTPQGVVWNYLRHYRKVGSVLLPHELEITVDGQSVQKLTFTKIELNIPVDKRLFQ